MTHSWTVHNIAAEDAALALSTHMDYHAKLGVSKYHVYVTEGVADLLSQPSIQVGLDRVFLCAPKRNQLRALWAFWLRWGLYRHKVDPRTYDAWSF